MHHVYRVIDGGATVYIGLSKRPADRLYAHKRNGKVSDAATVEIIESFEKRGPALIHEAAMIMIEKPPFNDIHNCKKVSGRARMSNEEARKVWFSKPNMLARNVPRHMPGWTYGMARYQFGPRRGGGIDDYTLRHKEVEIERIKRERE